jgi:hypothetical protein
MSIEKFISPLISSQFPSFYETEGPNFVAFVKAYYEWMESTYYQNNALDIIYEKEYNDPNTNKADYIKQEQPIALSRSLFEIKDVDSSPDKFVKYFKNKYISSLPSTIISDKKLLVKHILDLYRSKGAKRSYELLFRLLFNEDIEFVYPSDFIFKPSDATWHIPKYLEVSDHPLLKELIGKKIYTRNDGFAVVENYFVKLVNNKTINVLLLTGIQGNMQFGEQIYCDDLYVDNFNNVINGNTYGLMDAVTKQNFNQAFTFKNAPYIFGSLSSISITNGGAGFSIGQLLNIDVGGEGGAARVASTRSENGKVIFNLVNGGQGYTLNSQVTVSSRNGGGADATFEVGGLTDKRIYYIVRDKINTYKETAMEDYGQGVALTLTNFSSAFDTTNNNTIKAGLPIGATLTSIALSVTFDVVDNYGFISVANVGETFSNTSLGIDGLIAYRVDGNSISVTGDDSNLTNNNLLPGTVLISSDTNSIIKINNVYQKKTIRTTGIIEENDPSRFPSTVTGIKHIIVNTIKTIGEADNVIYHGGYFVPFNTITVNANMALTANIASTIRLTDWEFPRAQNLQLLSNLDTKMGQLFTTKILETGTITFLKNVNPGQGYSANPIVSILEPDIYDLKIKDNNNNYYGYDAQIDGIASTATGIVTAIIVEDSGYGYNPDQTITMSSAENYNENVVSGVAVVDSIGKGKGYYKNSKGFLSDVINIQDSYYYQDFSYEIVASRMKDTYEKYVKDLIHPSGMMLFGKFALTREIVNSVMETYEFDLQQRVYITVDRTDILSSAIEIHNDVLNTNSSLTIDMLDIIKPGTIIQRDN